MNNIKKNIRNNINIIKTVLISILIIIVIGLSYAFFYFDKSTTNELVYDGYGKLDMDLNNLASGITLNNQYPITDEDGRNQATSYTFTISGYSEIAEKPLYYEIIALPGSIQQGKTLFDDRAIKLYLTDDEGNSIYGPGFAYSYNDGGTQLVADSFVGGTESNKIVRNYILKVWIGDNVIISNQNVRDKISYTQEDYENRCVSIKLRVSGSTSPIISNNILNVINRDLSDNFYIPSGETEVTFIAGIASDTNYNPDNYLWYSGKLWRIVSLNKNDGVVTSIKLVTQRPISTVYFNSTLENGGTNDNSTFLNNYVYQWLNEDFYDTLRNPPEYIKTDYIWNSTDSMTVPLPKTNMLDSKIGLINEYEFDQSYPNTTASNSYLLNGFDFLCLNLVNNAGTYYQQTISSTGVKGAASTSFGYGLRPSINLKTTVLIVGGTGTSSDPYRLAGDNDNATELINDNINTRYSGEYVTFNGERYRIVNIENGLTKLVKEIYIKNGGTNVTKAFGTTNSFAQSLLAGTTYWGGYLNDNTASGWYGSLDSNNKDMIETATWYLGSISTVTSYKGSICAIVQPLSNGGTLTKNCTRTNSTAISKIGLLRIGEMFTSHQESSYSSSASIDLITPVVGGSNVLYLGSQQGVYSQASTTSVVTRPSFYLKTNVYITGGDGTSSNPFTISM